MTDRNSPDHTAQSPLLTDGYASVMPWIISRDTSAFLSFITDAFDAEEKGRVHNEDGTIGHAEALLNGSMILMFDGPDGNETRNFLRLIVDDAHAAYDRALRAGATSVTEVTYLFWGDEVGRVRDPFGNIWWLQSHTRDVAPDELEAAAGDPLNIAAMKYVQESLDDVFA